MPLPPTSSSISSDVTSLQRLVVSAPSSLVAPENLWRALLLFLAAAAYVVARACGYEFGTVTAYATYLALYVVLPGLVAMHLVNRGPLSLATVIALAVPTGFALEIFTFLGLAAMGAKALYAWTPLGWLALGVGLRLSRREWPVRLRFAGNHAGIAAALGAAFLGTTLMATSQMFAEAPLAGGLPTRAIFHDWVYLISRAAVIKNNWPLDDPSLSGTPLQYHYFMMVHAAAASWTAEVEIGTILLRLIYVPLGAALIAQAYLLGRAIARTPWGGVLAALMMVTVGEVSFAPSYGDPMFLGLFVRWLFVSPTFFFGMVYCGALLLAVRRGGRVARCDVRYYAWLVLLGTAGTGAKGTLLPVMVGALSLWALWRWWHEGRAPLRIIGFAVCLTGAFILVYLPTMFSWQTGDAKLNPFHVFQLTGFWKQHLAGCTQALAQVLPVALASPLAQVACAVVVFAGTCGVRLLAIPYLVWGDGEKRDPMLVGWMGSFFAASAGMGLLLELNSYGELYLILMMRLPLAVLTAGFFVAATRRIVAWWRPPAGRTDSASPFAVRPAGPGGVLRRAPWLPRFVVGGGVAVLIGALGVQTTLWWTRNRPGLVEWLNTSPNLKPDGYMQELQEALLWVRGNTEPNAVLVANAFTPENMRKDHWGALDHTLMGVHFYYSALSERRLWFEGPNYIMDTTRARIRASLASNFFYRGRPLDPTIVSMAPSYVLLDRSLKDDAVVTLPLGARVFSNARIAIYRLSEPAPQRVAGDPIVVAARP
jgi:hypothetical protein